MTEPIAYVLERLRAAIEQPPIAELGIDLSLDAEGRVRLSGPVASDEQRAALVAAVRREAPQLAVVDDLEVRHRPPDDGVEEIS